LRGPLAAVRPQAQHAAEAGQQLRRVQVMVMSASPG
jgi:hypothetical protein